MSDETRACDYPEDAAHENGNYVSKCIQCGESFIGHKRRFVCKRCASLPPTPDPRERGVNYAAMMAARDENERDAARVVDAYLADRGVRWSPGAAQMAADLLALEALRAPAPSEAVAEFSVCVWCSARVEWVASADRGEAEARLREHSATCPAHPAVIALATHPAPARGVTVTEAMVERAYRVMRDQYRDKALISPTAVRDALTAALTPDAEGGA